MRPVIFQDNDKITWMDQRWYRIEETDTYFPSVTTILEAYPKPFALFEWMKKHGENADEIRDAAAEVGSRVHQAIETYDKGIEITWADANGDPQYTLLEWQLICKYVEFHTKTNYELVCNEISYCSEKLRYGGTIDKIARFNGKLWLIDNKTSNAIYDSHWLQLAAYKRLWEEKNPDHLIDQIAILHLKAQTRTEGKGDAIQGKGWKLCLPEQPLEYYYDLFDATYKLWSSQNPSAKPLNRVYPAVLKKAAKEVEI